MSLGLGSTPPPVSPSAIRMSVGVPVGDTFGLGADFALDFIKEQYIRNDVVVGVPSDVLTVSRGGTAGFWDHNGELRTSTASTLRYTYDPETGRKRGLLIEPQGQRVTTNPYAPATQTQTLAAGSYITTAAGIGGSVAVSGGPSGTATPGSPFSFTLASSTAVTFTPSGPLRAFQCEAGSLATSIIPGTTAPVTRGSDIISGTALVSLLQRNQCSLLVEYETPSGLTATGIIVGWAGATANETAGIQVRTTMYSDPYVITGGADTSISVIAQDATPKIRRAGLVINDGLSFEAHNGGARISTGISVNSADPITRFNIGTNPVTGTAPCNTAIRRIAFYRRPLSRAELVKQVTIPVQNPVMYLWGFASARSGYVSARFNDAVGARLGRTRLAVFTASDFSGTPIYSSIINPDEFNGAKYRVDGLTPGGTLYTYAVEYDGVLDKTVTGQFKTAGASVQRIGHSACARSSSNATAFTKLLGQNLDAFNHLGDLGYPDPMPNDEGAFHAEFDTVFSAPAQHALYRSVSTHYIQSDHDYGTNNGDITSPCRPAFLAAYRRRVPHPPLVLNGPNDGTYHIVVRGRVVEIHTDLRSYRSNDGATDNSSKTMMGAVQKAWFKAQLTSWPGKMLVWYSDVPWNGPATSNNDAWRGFATERTELADAIKSAGITARFLVVQGDMHGMAADDGTHGDYSTTGTGCALPILQVAGLDQGVGAIDSGVVFSLLPSSQGTGQYGVQQWTDGGGNTIDLAWSGYNENSDTPTITFSRTFTLS